MIKPSETRSYLINWRVRYEPLIQRLAKKTAGKAFAGLIHLTRNGTIARGKNVLFIHTGGTPANFGYQSQIESMTIDF